MAATKHIAFTLWLYTISISKTVMYAVDALKAVGIDHDHGPLAMAILGEERYVLYSIGNEIVNVVPLPSLE